MFEILIPKEQAEKDVFAWMDYTRVKPGKRERLIDSIDVLIEAVMYGEITIDTKSFKISHKLNFPILDNSGTVVLDKLEYKPRITVNDIEKVMSAGEGLTKGYGAALTGQPTNYIGMLDSTDAKILSAIGVFFTN